MMRNLIDLTFLQTPLRYRKAERFYHVYLQNNFFNGVTVICSWGTFDSNRGGSKQIFCNDAEQINTALQEIDRTRIKRGYKSY